jgi:hypothetical protein
MLGKADEFNERLNDFLGWETLLWRTWNAGSPNL